MPWTKDAFDDAIAKPNLILQKNVHKTIHFITSLVNYRPYYTHAVDFNYYSISRL